MVLLHGPSVTSSAIWDEAEAVGGAVVVGAPEEVSAVLVEEVLAVEDQVEAGKLIHVK